MHKSYSQIGIMHSPRPLFTSAMTSQYHSSPWRHNSNTKNPTPVSRIVEHIEISEHSTKFAEKLIIEHLFYTISIATNNRTPGIFFHCVNSQTRLTIWDTRVLRKEKGWLTAVGHNSWWCMICAQHAAHNPTFLKMGLFRHPQWWP